MIELMVRFWGWPFKRIVFVSVDIFESASFEGILASAEVRF